MCLKFFRVHRKIPIVAPALLLVDAREASPTLDYTIRCFQYMCEVALLFYVGTHSNLNLIVRPTVQGNIHLYSNTALFFFFFLFYLRTVFGYAVLYKIAPLSPLYPIFMPGLEITLLQRPLARHLTHTQPFSSYI